MNSVTYTSLIPILLAQDGGTGNRTCINIYISLATHLAVHALTYLHVLKKFKVFTTI